MKKSFLVTFLLILIGTIFYFFANFQRIAIPGAVFDLLQTDLDISAPYITAFGAIFMFVYGILQLIVGVVTDRFGGFRVFFLGAVLFTLGCIIFPLFSNIWIMYIARALIGAGCATFYLSLIKELKGKVKEADFGIAIAVILVIGYAGGIFANAPFIYLIKYSSWRFVLLETGIFLPI